MTHFCDRLRLPCVSLYIRSSMAVDLSQVRTSYSDFPLGMASVWCVSIVQEPFRGMCLLVVAASSIRIVDFWCRSIRSFMSSFRK